MAFYDDRRWLLKHIRHSFITGDDSQLCEHVLLNNDFPLPKGDYDSDDDKVINDEDASAVLSESPDIFVGSARHRPRTYTAIRLEQMKKDRERTNAVRQVVWSMNQEDSPDEADLDEMFARKDVKPKRAVPKTSKLTAMLKDAPAVPPNPYTAYARYDGAHCFGEIPAKRIRIFVTMIPAPACFQPLEISIIPSAKVSDLIGLACWQYTSQRRQPPLPHDGVDAYRLLFAEEDGEFDYDFPPLEKTEVVSKFHFSSLALVEAATADASRSSVSATRSLVSLAKVVIMPSRDTVDVILPVTGGAGLTVSDLMRLTEEQCPDPKVVNRLKSKTFIVKEKGDPANAILSLNARITDCRSREFIFAPSETRAEEIRMRKHLNVMEAALYQSFTVSLMTRLGATTEIHLGISGEKIEVNPVTKSGGLIGMLVPSNAKPMTYNIDTIADCSIVDEKFGKKAVVRIVHKTPTGEYKHFDFECNHDIARTIDQKCKAILNLFGSATRQEYLESDFGRKPGRRWLFKKQ